MQHRIKKTAVKLSPDRAPYPVPGAVGGRLVRLLIKELRVQVQTLPITSHILCACSGGSDSVALAVLLARYGRRAGSKIALVHVNHGWRGEESDADEAFVRKLARELNCKVVIKRIRQKPKLGDSWEAHARTLRKEFFRAQSLKHENAFVLTAHSADDQAETRLWRILTGAPTRLAAGILPRHGVEIRPFLGVRRTELRAFLREENRSWREDSSNVDQRFMRARMRHELMPLIERLFPRCIEAINRSGR